MVDGICAFARVGFFSKRAASPRILIAELLGARPTRARLLLLAQRASRGAEQKRMHLDA